jgi:uncharacterized membrane protein
MRKIGIILAIAGFCLLIVMIPIAFYWLLLNSFSPPPRIFSIVMSIAFIACTVGIIVIIVYYRKNILSDIKNILR